MKSFKVGITGGIGSGKSYIAKVFKTLNIPFYDADREAKALMNTSEIVRQGLVEAFGTQVYQENGLLNRKWLADQVFNNVEKLALLNSIVRPVVIQHAEARGNAQQTCYNLKEAALLFESGSYKTLDYTILVVAPQDIRIKRVIQRDNVSKDEVINRINKQMPDESKMELANFIIVNDEKTPLLPQIYNIHKLLLSKC